MKAVCLIPSRLESVRLPGKALMTISGIPLVIHTMLRAKMSGVPVYVCTDSVAVANAVTKYGGDYIMTGYYHPNGTTRIKEAKDILAAYGLTYDLYVDVQGDEPLLDPEHIKQVINAHVNKPTSEILLPHLVMEKDPGNSVVKVVKSDDGRVVYLSRASVPHQFHGQSTYRKHLSVISFTAEALDIYCSLSVTKLETIEGIELLRAVDHGMQVNTVELEGDSFSVDTPDDYARAVVAMYTDPLFQKGYR